MKTKHIAILAALGLPLSGFSQATPPTPPTPASPAVAPVPPVPPLSNRDRGPKVPVTYLGVETSEVPSVVAEQLGLPKGFGVVVDYIQPDSPAAAAGLQPNDIIKMLNDQILVDTDQLSKLVRSYKEGDTISLTVMRKGAETKLSAKLQKRDVPQRFERMRHSDHFGLGPDFEQQMRDFGQQMKDMQIGNIQETVRQAREQARMARQQAREIAQEAKREAKGIHVITNNDNGVMKTTKIDLGKAEISYTDAQGEMKIEVVDGKKMLTAKDAQGKLLFSGPVSAPEELNKVPADVRQRYDKLEQKDLPALRPNYRGVDNDDDGDNDFDVDVDVNVDSDNDSDNDSGGDVESLEHISMPATVIPFPSSRLGINTVLI